MTARLGARTDRPGGIDARSGSGVARGSRPRARRRLVAVALVACLAASCAGLAGRSPAATGAAFSGPPLAPPGLPHVTPAGRADEVRPSVPSSVPPTSARPPTLAVARWPAPVLDASNPAFALSVPILMFHRVHATGPGTGLQPSPLIIEPSVFAAEMEDLATAGWRTITLAELEVDLAQGVAPGPRTVVLTFDDGYRDSFTNVLPILQRLDFVATFFIVTGRLGRPDILTVDQVRALAAAGMEIGDHTVGHRDVALADAAMARFQVETAAVRIAQLTGMPPATFAYPFGDVNPAAVRVIHDAGFGIAVTNRPGVSETWGDRFVVPRLEVAPEETGPGLVSFLSSYAS